MKHILFTTLTAVAVLLSSCSKDNGGGEPNPTFPIQGLEMPASSAEHPIMAGTTVNLKGIGFTASDEIWLGNATKATDAIKVEGVVATSTGLSFTAPAINGESSITLKQAGKDYLLGKIYFSTGSQPGTEHLYAVKGTHSGAAIFGEYDLTANTFKPVFTSPTSVESCIGDNNSNFYYITYDVSDEFGDTYLTRYNLIEKKEVRLAVIKKNDFAFIGIIDNKLHYLKYDETNGFRLLTLTDDGKEQVVKSFGQLPDPTYTFFDNEDARFVYDATSKSILVVGASEYNNGKNTAASVLSFSLETGSIRTKHHADPSPAGMTSTWYTIAKIPAGVLLFTLETTWSETEKPDDTEVSKTEISYIDPTTLSQKSVVASFDSEFRRPTYVAGKNMLMGIDTDFYKPYTAWSYDLTDKSLKKVNSTEDFECMFTMNY